jgi:hypothetical protein
MKYVAIFRQYGEGCDYTIACGQKSFTFDALADDVAHEFILNKIREEHASDDYKLELVQLFRVGEEIKVDLKALYSEINSDRQAEEAGRKLRKAEQELAQAQKAVAEAEENRKAFLKHFYETGDGGGTT